MAECEKYIEQISALIDAELSDAEEAAVLEHIAECPGCRALYETFCEISRCIPQISVEPPSNLTDSIMQKINAEAKKARKPMRSLYKIAGLAAVFALVIFAALNGGRVAAPDSREAPAVRVEAQDESTPKISLMATPNYAGSAEAADSSNNEESGTETPSHKRPISDMTYFINYLESIPPEEYEDAVNEYGGDLYAVLVLEGDLPEELGDTEKLLENKNEVYLRLSREEIENLSKNSSDSLLIMNDEAADKGIVIIKKDED